jgi:GT2 family glycosyltransferase
MKFDVSIIYVYYNTPEALSASIQSVFNTTQGLKIQIVVVDNGSPKRVPKDVVEQKGVIVISSKNIGYGAGMNKGVQHARSKKLILVNPDTIFHKNAINFLITKMDDEKIGVVGPQMVDENGSILPTISGKATLLSILFTNSFLNKMFPRHRIARSFWMQNVNRNKEQSVSVISGACMAMRKKVFEDVGGFDERFFMYFEETDLCLRVKKMQLSVKYFPSASIYHTVGASSRDKEKIESQKKKESKKDSQKIYISLLLLLSKIIHESLRYWRERSERQYISNQYPSHNL